MPINRLLTPFNRHTYCRLRNAKLLCQNTLADAKLAHGPITYDVDEAEAVCRRLSEEYPDQIDGIHRLAQVYEARGEKSKAAEYYRKTADFARSMPGFDQESIDGFLSDARRMESEK